MEIADSVAPSRHPRKIKIYYPEVRTPEELKHTEEQERYARLVPDELEPNFGRVQEIKEEIRNGTYLTREKIEETAARLAIRFIRTESSS